MLALILIYIGVGAAETVEGWRDRRPLWSAACTLGPLLLLWVLYRNIYPVPEFPNNLWPYAAFLWVIASVALIRLRPGVATHASARFFVRRRADPPESLAALEGETSQNLKFAVTPGGARLIGGVTHHLRNIELEARVVGRDQRDFVGEVVHEQIRRPVAVRQGRRAR